uniref:ureidoglycolate lyase n=1 Tax=Paracoccus sp. TaxID=267 RepID=UPI003342040E
LLSKSPAELTHDEYALDMTLDFYDVQPANDPLQINIAERHEHSSQMFVPMSGQHYLVIVWDDHPAQDGKVRAFVGAPDDVVIYKPGIWHHGIISLNRPGVFASTMWRTRGGTDVEFLQVPQPFVLPLQELPQ